MSKRRHRVDSKEVGLDIGLCLFRFLFDSEYMHYGYWPPDLEVMAPNLKKAQENYTQFLFAHIPASVRTILDVGCGSGKIAMDLIERGYQVTCVSPPSQLTARAAQRLAGKAPVHQARYEDFVSDQRFDMVLFSESYQYINMQAGMRQSLSLVKPGGHILLCDFFRTEAPGRSPLGGGHRLVEFYQNLEAFPVRIVDDIDITEFTAPTMKLVNRLTMEVALPAIQLVAALAQDRHPWIYRFLTWHMRKKIEKNRKKHFEGQRNAENFKKYKSYRLVLLQGAAATGSPAHEVLAARPQTEGVPPVIAAAS